MYLANYLAFSSGAIRQARYSERLSNEEPEHGREVKQLTLLLRPSLFQEAQVLIVTAVPLRSPCGWCIVLAFLC